MNVVEGMIKIHIMTNSGANVGKTVVVGRGTNTWEAILDSNGEADIYIPSIPNMANARCYADLYNGDTSTSILYRTWFTCGFGDCIDLPLWAGGQPVKQYQLDTTNNNVSNLSTALGNKITYGQSDKVDGSSSLTTGTIYCYY